MSFFIASIIPESRSHLLDLPSKRPAKADAEIFTKESLALTKLLTTNPISLFVIGPPQSLQERQIIRLTTKTTEILKITKENLERRRTRERRAEMLLSLLIIPSIAIATYHCSYPGYMDVYAEIEENFKDKLKDLVEAICYPDVDGENIRRGIKLWSKYIKTLTNGQARGPARLIDAVLARELEAFRTYLLSKETWLRGK